MAVNSFVMLAMGRGSETFSASIGLLEEQSRQYSALAFTGGLWAPAKILGADNEAGSEGSGFTG